MRCMACELEHDRAMFPAPEAIVPLCNTCLGKLLKAEKVKCRSCGVMDVLAMGHKCRGGGRKVKGDSHVIDSEAIQNRPDGG